MKATLLQSNSDLVDVHVLHYAGITPTQLDRCLDKLSGQPVNVHLIENDGTLLEGRLFGYAQGRCPYVSYVDADDWVEPLFGVIADVRALLPKALFTGGWTGDRQTPLGLVHRPAPHQLVVYDRGYITEINARIQARPQLMGLLDFMCDLAAMREISLDGAWTYCDRSIYHYLPSANGARVAAGTALGEVTFFYDDLRRLSARAP